MNSNQKTEISLSLRKFLDTEGFSSDNFKNGPIISVITSSFNQSAFLERTIRSVINQDYRNTEHIVIDGGSTDGSVSILRRYTDRLAYWVSEPDEGQTDAINKGIAKATGDLIAFQNSDDVYLPGAFDAVAKAAMNNLNAGLFYADFLHIDSGDNVLDEQLLGVAKYWIQVFLGPQVHNQAAFWRREIVEKVGLLDPRYQFDMDYEYFSRILFNGYKAVHIPHYLAAFRHHGETKTSNLQEVSKRELRKVSEHYRNQSIFLKIVPRRLGRLAAMICKAIHHVRSGRADYLFRDRLHFK